MLILPLGTHREAKPVLPVLTLLVCLACIAVHFTVTNEATKMAFAYDPRSWNVGHMMSATFLHADLSHLLGNLFFFYCFSSTIEKEITAKGYLAVFLVFAVVTHVAYSLMTKVYLPTLGLSGVVWGFMGLFIARFPFQKVECFVWFLWMIRTISVPAIVFVFGYLAMDIGAFRRNEPGVNHLAHLSGFMAGLVLVGLWGVLERDDRSRVVRTRPRPGRATPLQQESLREHDWN